MRDFVKLVLEKKITNYFILMIDFADKFSFYFVWLVIIFL